jgi:ketosteroid isomerase-like protein
MSEENVEFVRGVLRRFAAGDRESWREDFAEDVIWDVSNSMMPEARVYEGHDGLERFVVDWFESWAEARFEDVELIDTGDSVVSVFRWKARGKTSGVETDVTWAGIYEVEDGQIVRYRGYDTREAALEAAGLRE